MNVINSTKMSINELQLCFIITGFFKFVVTPLITQWHRFLHNDLSTQMLYNLMYNQNRWETLVNEEANEETKTEISDADMAEDDLEIDNESLKSETSRLLLPPRRASLNPVKKKSPFKDQIRRFSVPLNVFQDVRLRLRERSQATSLADERARNFASVVSSQPSLHSQLSVRGHCSHPQEPEKQLNSENLVPDSTIASITTPAQAVRLNTVLRQGGTVNKLVRQKTFPPLESSFWDSSEDSDFVTRFRSDPISPVPGTSKKEPKYSFLIVRDIQKTDSEDTSDTSVEGTPRKLEKENSAQRHSRKESSTVGSQLRDNLTWMPLELESDPLLQRRRKSMPAEVLPFSELFWNNSTYQLLNRFSLYYLNTIINLTAPREKKIREVPTALPQFLRRTFSGKESWTKRRGSAPSPVAPSDSELRGLAALGSLRHSVNGGRRKPSLTVTCQQWLAKATHGVQERTLQQFPRRSSLPAEVMTGAQ